MRAPIKPFVVVRAKLEPRPKLGEVSRPEPVVDQARLAEERRRERRIKGFASEAFKRWRPG